MPGFSAIAVAPIGALSQDAVVGVGSLQFGISVPPPAAYNSAIAAFPICSLPALDGRQVVVTTGVNAVIASQSLALTESSVYVSDDDVIDVAGQVLLSTLNNLTVTTSVEIALDSQALTLTESSVQAEVQPPAFDSQSMALVQNSAAVSTGHTLPVTSQEIDLTLHSVDYSTGVNVHVLPEGVITYGDDWAIASQPICGTPSALPYIASGMVLSENSVSLNLDAVLMAPSYQLATTVNSVSLITDQNIVAPSQTIYTTLNDLRLWYDFPTDQPGNCPDHCDGTWTTIAFDEEVFGEDWAIATQAIGILPQTLPPIRKYPGVPWNNVSSQTTTTWTNIPT